MMENIFSAVFHRLIRERSPHSHRMLSGKAPAVTEKPKAASDGPDDIDTTGVQPVKRVVL